MAQGPENRFIAAVHRQLPPEKEFYREKMNNPYRGGTFDVWYSAKKDLWIEYKWLTRTPTRAVTVPVKLLEPLQLLWGVGRHKEGRNVFVVVGCPDGGVLFRREAWEEGVSAEEFRKALLTKFALAEWIFSFATGEKLDANRIQAVQHCGSDGIGVQDPADGVSDL